MLAITEICVVNIDALKKKQKSLSGEWHGSVLPQISSSSHEMRNFCYDPRTSSSNCPFASVLGTSQNLRECLAEPINVVLKWFSYEDTNRRISFLCDCHMGIFLNHIFHIIRIQNPDIESLLRKPVRLLRSDTDWASLRVKAKTH